MPGGGAARRAGEESLHRKQREPTSAPHGRGEVTPRERHRKAGEEHRGRDAPAPRAERTAAKSAQPQSSRVCTPSFNERSECPKEGWPVGAGEESIRRKECQPTSGPKGRGELTPRQQRQKAGEEHRGRDAPAPRAERTAPKSAKLQSAVVICTPSFNERSECPEEGWPARAGEESLHSEQCQQTSGPQSREGVSSP